MKILDSLIALISRKQRYPMILVTGSPKTGTTALYHSIKNALPQDSICQFEPENRNLPVPERNDRPVLVKSFIPACEAYDFFEKKILITRDPRDHLISNMLYRPYNIFNRHDRSDTGREQFKEDMLSLLKKKEASPLSVSVREIQELQDRWNIPSYGLRMIKYYHERPGIFLFKYEDYIDKKLMALSAYLGISLDTVSDVPQKRVIRSKAYGNWKDWFTPSDVEHYRPLFQDYMAEFGYEDAWELNPNPKIDPALSSQYVMRIIEEAIEIANDREKRSMNNG